MPNQIFKITRAPEEKSLTEKELQYLLYKNRPKSEWVVVEEKSPVDNQISQPGVDEGGRPGYLGWANGWNGDPAIYTHCKELRHQRQHYKIGNCQHMETCEICGYWFKYDSSG